jgi:putative flippase GtrA
MTAEIKVNSVQKNRTQWLKNLPIKSVLEILKFSVVGILNTLLDAFIYFSLTRWVGLAAVGAKALSYSAGMLNSYILNSRFTFQAQDRSIRQIILFISLNLGVLGINTGIMALGYQILQFPELLILAGATGATFLVNFWFSKRVIFR